MFGSPVEKISAKIGAKILPKKIGIFGGAFDPVHQAHIKMANQATLKLGLDLMVFVPSYSSPPKFGNFGADFSDRVNMLALALQNYRGKFEISDIEKRAAKLWYALDTAQAMAQRFVGAELFWLLGADQLSILHKWKGIEELASLVNFAYFERKDVDISNVCIPKNAKLIKIDFLQNGISSSAVRTMIKSKKTKIKGLDKSVADYIAKNLLYSD